MSDLKNRIKQPFFKPCKFIQNGTIHIGKDEVSSSNLLISSIKNRIRKPFFSSLMRFDFFVKIQFGYYLATTEIK